MSREAILQVVYSFCPSNNPRSHIDMIRAVKDALGPVWLGHGQPPPIAIGLRILTLRLHAPLLAIG